MSEWSADFAYSSRPYLISSLHSIKSRSSSEDDKFLMNLFGRRNRQGRSPSNPQSPNYRDYCFPPSVSSLVDAATSSVREEEEMTAIYRAIVLFLCCGEACSWAACSQLDFDGIFSLSYTFFTLVSAKLQIKEKLVS